jgi:hypothetical protein
MLKWILQAIEETDMIYINITDWFFFFENAIFKSLRQGRNNQLFLNNHPLRTYGTLNRIQNKTITGGDTSKPVGNRKQT